MKKFFLVLLLFVAFFALPVRGETAVSGSVRVLLTRPRITDTVTLSLDGSYTLGSLSFQRGSSVTVSASSGTLMVYYEGMTFDAGSSLCFIRHAITGNDENGIRINGSYDLHPGDLSLTFTDGSIRAILTLPVEEYLLGVVPFEMSDSFPIEALKAQAIAARTYAISKAGSKGDFDLYDNTNDQVYYGVRAENKNAAKAVSETAGICVFYKNKPAMCYYTASNGGRTELAQNVWDGGGDYGYLSSAQDKYDLENPDSPVNRYSIPKSHPTGASFGDLAPYIEAAVDAAKQANGLAADAVTQIVSLDSASTFLPQSNGSAVMTKLRLSFSVNGECISEEGNTSTVQFDAVAVIDLFPSVKNALNLALNGTDNEVINVTESKDSFTLEARRYGHGVGMSQRGAQWMASCYHWNYEQILRFYYPGATLKKLTYTYKLPTALPYAYMVTPGPAATPTPRPTPAPLLTTPAPGQYVVTVNNISRDSSLNLRSEPSTASSILRVLYYGQQLIVTEVSGEWLHVKADDFEGYVMSKFVSLPEP